MEWVTVNFLLKVLGVIALLVLFRPAEKFFKNLVRAHAGHFEPYRVWIEPNWFQLLLDYGLVKDLDEWHEVWARIDHIPASDYDVLRDGISFTVLKPDLIYRDDHKKFSTSVKFEEPIMEVSLLHSGGWEYHPRIYIGFAGYAIKSLPEGAYGISVTPADSAKCSMRDWDGCAVVALLPWVEFVFHREDPGEFSVKRWSKLSTIRDRRRAEHGWTQVETDSDGPTSIEHKYFTVRHKRI